MSKHSSSYEAFFHDCFLGKDPICDLRREDSLELDRYASDLISKMLEVENIDFNEATF